MKACITTTQQGLPSKRKKPLLLHRFVCDEQTAMRTFPNIAKYERFEHVDFGGQQGIVIRFVSPAADKLYARIAMDNLSFDSKILKEIF